MTTAIARLLSCATLILLWHCTTAFSQTSELVKRDDKALDAFRSSFGSNTSRSDLGNALLEAVVGRQVRSATWLVENGADCDYRGKGELTPLMAYILSTPKSDDEDEGLEEPEWAGAQVVPWKDARSFDQAESQLLSLLMSCTKQLDAQNARGAAAIHLATSKRRSDVLRRIVEAGANVNLSLPDGKTALLLSSPSQFRWLVSAGARVRHADSQGRSLLHHLTMSRQGDRLIIALEKAIAVGARDTKDASGHFAGDLINGFTTEWMALRLLDNAGAERKMAQAQRMLRAVRE